MDAPEHLEVGRYDSFVVRFRWHGGEVQYVTVTHVDSGQVRRFRNPQDALAFMLTCAPPKAAAPPGPEAA